MLTVSFLWVNLMFVINQFHTLGIWGTPNKISTQYTRHVLYIQAWVRTLHTTVHAPVEPRSRVPAPMIMSESECLLIEWSLWQPMTVIILCNILNIYNNYKVTVQINLSFLTDNMNCMWESCSCLQVWQESISSIQKHFLCLLTPNYGNPFLPLSIHVPII